MPRWPDSERTALALIRVKSGLSREKAAVNLGVSMDTLRRYEIGRNDIPMLTCEKMAEIYNVPFETIRQAVLDMYRE